MPCFHPKPAYQSLSLDPETGKRSIQFDADFADSPLYEAIELPCGRCMGCRIKGKQEWSIRCMHEASMHKRNCAVTLTYANDYLDPYGGINVGDFQAFMKRIRRRFPEHNIRFFECDEYGEDRLRPHIHAILFGFQFPDLVQLRKGKNGNQYYSSEILRDLWPFGHCEAAECTWEAAQYIAGYVTKKITGPGSEDHCARVVASKDAIWHVDLESVHMSRAPGLGTEWIEANMDSVYESDFVRRFGKRFAVPSHYDHIVESYSRELVEASKARRRAAAKEAAAQECNSKERLRDRERCAELNAKRFKREMV